MLLHTGFNCVGSVPFAQLRKSMEPEKWERIKDNELSDETLKYLVEEKMVQLARYDEILEDMNALYDKFETGEVAADGFLETAIPVCKGMESSESNPLAKEETRGKHAYIARGFG
jgi:hypothetical protein